MNTTQATTNEHCIDVCNSLLRGEISAVETYNLAIEKFSDSHDCRELVGIRDEHSQAIGRLRAKIGEMDGAPSTDSGAWGTFAKAVQGAADLLGENSALTALKQGEEHGRDEYQEALDDDGVMAPCKEMIRNELLPQTQRHIGTLERMER